MEDYVMPEYDPEECDEEEYYEEEYDEQEYHEKEFELTYRDYAEYTSEAMLRMRDLLNALAYISWHKGLPYEVELLHCELIDLSETANEMAEELGLACFPTVK